MNKQFINTGHYKLIQRNLETFVSQDNPNCQGNSRYRLCPFSNAECKKQCYENQSKTCATYHYLERTKSHYDKLGANLR